MEGESCTVLRLRLMRNLAMSLKSHCESVALADELIKTTPRRGHLNTPELPIGPAVRDRQSSEDIIKAEHVTRFPKTPRQSWRISPRPPVRYDEFPQDSQYVTHFPKTPRRYDEFPQDPSMWPVSPRTLERNVLYHWILRINHPVHQCSKFFP